MDCKKISFVACGLALGAVALMPNTAKAQDTMSGGATSGGTMMQGSSMDQPMMVTGTVLRYYADRAGYVTAMDVQTAQGVQFVRFSPSMGQRLYSTYPVGGQVTVYATSSMMRGGTSYNVVSMGEKMPSPEAMTMRLTDADLLDSPAYIMTGARMITVSGKLSDVITNDMGEVIGLVLDGAEQQVMSQTGSQMVSGRIMMVAADGQMMPVKFNDGRTTVKMADNSNLELTMSGGRYVIPESMTGAQMKMVMEDGRQMNVDTVDGRLMVMMADGTMMPVQANGGFKAPVMMAESMAAPMMGMQAATGTLVRVPREFRHAREQQSGTDRISPLFKGSIVEVTGYPEAPRYGVVSLYANRIAANALVINSRAVGALGIPRLTTGQRALFRNVNIGGSSQNADEARAAQMGYSTYGSSGMMGGQPMMTEDGQTR